VIGVVVDELIGFNFNVRRIEVVPGGFVTAATSSRNSSSMQVDAKLRFFNTSADRRHRDDVHVYFLLGGHEGLSQKSLAALATYWHSDDLR
jgi:hypothetical protein